MADCRTCSQMAIGGEYLKPWIGLDAISVAPAAARAAVAASMARLSAQQSSAQGRRIRCIRHDKRKPFFGHPK
jgi:hypothetical protein